MSRSGWIAGALVVVVLAVGGGLMAQTARPHNLVIFVADGLRSQIVTPQTAPAMAAVRAEGVDFQNSHSVYPTITTVNASAIATGHLPGDHGDFGNTLFVGQKLPFPVASTVAAMEDDEALGLMNDQFGGHYLNEISLLAAARAKGFQTAVLGKMGPVAIQDVTARKGETIVIDDQTGWEGVGQQGLPVPAKIRAAMKAAGLSPKAPDRGLNSSPGAYNMAGARVANVEQQRWFADIATKVLLPRFARARKPFVLIYWSRDPDGTQHNQGDSLGTLTPGINGPTTMAAIRNASDNLAALRKALTDLGLDKTTDVVVTADHGFSTLGKESATSAAARSGFRDVMPGKLPHGFVGLDLAKALGLPIFEANGLAFEESIKLAPKSPGLLLGADANAPQVVVVANGGSDLIYLPRADKALAARVVAHLTAQDYTANLFVDDRLGPILGTLPMSAIGFKGKALTPQPAIIVGFRSWTTGCARPDTCTVEIADTPLQQGQGIHGTFSRADTHNFMAAVGPDFRKAFVDPSPVSNVDLAVTLAKALHLDMPPKGALSGRVLSEALKSGQPVGSTRATVRSAPAVNGFVTVLNTQSAGGKTYYDAAGMPGRVFGLQP